uniref:Uncharacterized protein n=1 Tax=Cyclopterus lumpus TaxID=8103 RepID=A0A8C3G4S4_CYCLU
MQSGLDDMTKQRMLQAKALCKEARGEGVNIGKKSSVPKDVMLEELNLPSNRGSRMFQERQKRTQGGKENRAFSIPSKHSLVMNLQKTVAKKGSPDVLAPGKSQKMVKKTAAR